MRSLPQHKRPNRRTHRSPRPRQARPPKILSRTNRKARSQPKFQQGPNMHIATSAQTVMVINQDGHLDTHGPSRTEIRQEPKEEKPGSSGATPSPSPKP